MIASTMRATRSAPSSGTTAATRAAISASRVGSRRSAADGLTVLHRAGQRRTAGEHVAEHEVDLVDQPAQEGQRVARPGHAMRMSGARSSLAAAVGALELEAARGGGRSRGPAGWTRRPTGRSPSGRMRLDQVEQRASRRRALARRGAT